MKRDLPKPSEGQVWKFRPRDRVNPPFELRITFANQDIVEVPGGGFSIDLWNMMAATSDVEVVEPAKQ